MCSKSIAPFKDPNPTPPPPGELSPDFSSIDVDASATLQMDGLSLNAEPAYDDETEEFDIDGECTMTEYVGQSGVIEGENPVPPDVGMEFETYEE
ncbi:hypothetical protein K7X08_004092 [Anisodus acutangulus]|uniref:Uncharacterized protein n=1 Tax=Anisodus acutangulus TaxID=402998 RepID=A0A9Q1MKF5_9SOLA|nr:hypothetical protein K7X08_004092 [Anisodus acutangulus]